MKNYKIHLIRHGFTADNESAILGGSGRDLPLSDAGRSEIQRLKDAFAYPPVEVLFTSPMMRAVQTAQIIYPNNKALLIAPLVEVNFGELEGMNAADVAKTGFWDTWRDKENPVTPEGAETYEQFLARVTIAFATLLEGMMRSGVKEAAIVTHGGVISSILGKFGLPEHHEDFWLANNGAGYTMSVSTSVWQRINKAEVTQILPAGYEQALEDQTL